LRAAHCGLEVLVLEKSDKLGGTSAMSGAGIWIPANHLALAEDVEDTVDEGLAHIRSTAPEGWGQTEDERWATFAHIAPRALEFIDQKTPLIFLMTNEPDPFTEAEGGKARGRQLTVAPLSRWRIGHLSRRLRRTTLVNLFNCHEMTSIAPYHRPFPAIWKLLPRLTWRLLTNSRGQGNALMTGLIRGCLDADVSIERNAAATNLVQDEEGRVTGVKTQVAGRKMTLSGGKGVLIATRGFE
jgi:3-oxosteroid 1-dehydrogenase